MKFRDHIPPSVLENYEVDRLIQVLDELQTYKEISLYKVERGQTVVGDNLSYLRKRLEDYGHPPIPEDFPKEVVDALLLNSANIMRLKGSRLGLRLWLWCLTFSEPVIDDSSFYPIPSYIILGDHQSNGFVSHLSVDFGYDLYLFSGNAIDFGNSVLLVELPTKYHYMKSLRQYINDNIRKFLSFVSEDADIQVSFSPGSYTSFDEAYPYFVN